MLKAAETADPTPPTQQKATAQGRANKYSTRKSLFGKRRWDERWHAAIQGNPWGTPDRRPESRVPLSIQSAPEYTAEKSQRGGPGRASFGERLVPRSCAE